MKVVAGYKTYAGNFREINQDAAILRVEKKDGQYFAILGVCDGIGGLERGEVASQITVKRISQWFDGVMKWVDITTVEGNLVFSHLKDLIEECNSVIREYSVVNRVNIGTTLSLLMILREEYYIIQVGDSRVYHYRGKKLIQLTVDASVTKMNDNGRIKTYLDNYLGKDSELWFTSIVGKWQDKDAFLVCSDGLYRRLCQEDIVESERDIWRRKRIGSVCTKLVQKVLDRGEKDNVTIGIIGVSE